MFPSRINPDFVCHEIHVIEMALEHAILNLRGGQQLGREDIIWRLPQEGVL